MIISKTPYRISLFGGGTDHPFWFNRNGGKVISFSINKFCYITCRFLPPFFDYKYRFVYSKIETTNKINLIKHPAIKGVLKKINWNGEGLEIHHDGDLPARSGMGSSSSFTVGLLNAIINLQGKKSSKRNLAFSAIDVEQRIIKETVGSQDQIAAAYGGLNCIEFYKKNQFKVQSIDLKLSQYKKIEKNLLLIYTGISRYSSDIEKKKFNKSTSINSSLKLISDITNNAYSLLQKKIDINELGRMLNETWEIKKSLSGSVSNNKIDTIYDIAKKNGALGGKLLGAGGGGFLLIMAPIEAQIKIKKKLKNLFFVPFKIHFTGSEIVVNQPNGFNE